MFSRRKPQPDNPRDLQQRAFEAVEDLLAALPPGSESVPSGFGRLRVLLLATPALPEPPLHAQFVDGYSQHVAPAWRQFLEAASLDRFANVPLVFEVVTAPEDAPDPVSRAALERTCVAVRKETAAEQGVRLRLDVDDPSLVLRGHAVVVEPGRAVNIGRQDVVSNVQGDVVRTNQIAFKDRPDLRFIARMQARVRYDIERNGFVLLDSGSRRTQVLRDGEPVPVVPPLPTLLADGDVLYLGPGVTIRCRLDAA